MPGDNTGLFGQLQQSLGTVIELLRVRLALLGTELGLEKQRLGAGLFWGAMAFMCLTVAAVLLCGFVLLLFWDGYRLAAMGILALLFLAGGLLLLQVAQRRLSAASNLFSTSLAELERDRAAFTAPAPNEPQ
jgi:uncharacterized membrane protein YqjE